MPGEIEQDAVGGLVVGRLEDLDEVVTAEGHVHIDEPPPARGDRALALLYPVAPGREPSDAL